MEYFFDVCYQKGAFSIVSLCRRYCSKASQTFELPNPDKPDDTPLSRGEFDIVKALLVRCPELQSGKILADKVSQM